MSRFIHLRKNFSLNGFRYKYQCFDSINSHVDTNIPKLAWVAELMDGKANFTLGSEVERSNAMIFEGVWYGDYRDSSPTDSDVVFGSGAEIVNGRLIFVTPKHNLESLFVLVNNKTGHSYVSNSFNYLFVRAGINTSSKFFKAFSTIIQDSASASAEIGVDRYERIIHRDEHWTMYRMTYYNFSVSRNGLIKSHWQKPRYEYRDYESYKQYLESTIQSIAANAQSPHRKKQKYKLLSSISKGYDSPAVSVLAKSAGLKQSVTLDIAVYDFNDSGQQIAKKLGLEVNKCEHILSNNINNLNTEFDVRLKKKAYEFIACDGIGDDVAFLGFEKYLKSKLYCSGTYGDVVWSKKRNIRPAFSKQVFEKSLTEFRLRVGFVNMPVIAIGARFGSALGRISVSEEMNHYSIGGDYDRPIPRRLVETAGVPRDYFGMQKSASSPMILNNRELFSEACEYVMQRYL